MSKTIFLLALLLVLAILLLNNVRALYEGTAYYLLGGGDYHSNRQAVDRAGRYASLYDLVQLKNQDRLEYIRRHLELPGVTVTVIPIPGSPFSNVLARWDSTGPYTIYCAHYDKAIDDPNFQAASDNTASVSVLLAAVTDLAQRGGGGQRAFLFTGEEEIGLRGASAFVDYARANQIAIREFIDYDSLGRDQLAIRPSANLPGFQFTLPLYGDIVYDGNAFHSSPAYPPANPRLTQALLQVQPRIVVLQRFAALSDSNVFEANGIDTVAISSSNMSYLQLAWDTYADQVDLLDERNLDLAFDLVRGYPANP